jgi:phosphate transport system substrate-binding protein
MINAFSFKKIILLSFFLFTLLCCKNRSNEKDKSIIVIKGSDSELNLLKFFSNKYKTNRPELRIEITGGGTAHGIKALINRETNIAIASRVITNEELEEAKENGVTPVPFVIAQDVVAIITHPKTGVDSLSLEQLSKIFNGEIANWKDVGGLDMAIKIYGRDKNSGTRYYLKDKLSIKKIPSNYIEMNGNVQIIEQVSKDKGAIAYVNVGSITNECLNYL